MNSADKAIRRLLKHLPGQHSQSSHGGGGAAGSAGGGEFDRAGSVKAAMADAKKAGYSRLKMEREVVQFPKKVTSNIEVGQRMERQGWKSANREGAINRGNKVTYMTKEKFGIEIDAGSSQWGQGVTIHPWKPREEKPKTSLAEIEEMGR